MICHKRKIVFIHIPKCAGTSIESALGHSRGGQLRGSQDHRSLRMLVQPIPWRKALTSKDHCQELLRRLKYSRKQHQNARNQLQLSAAQYAEYFKFTFVRNPWARAYSWYKNVVRDSVQQTNLGVPADIPFADFLYRFAGSGMLKPQLYWLRDFDNRLPFDFIGRFELLQQDFEKICDLLSIDHIELPHQIKGGGQNEYQQAYDKDLIRFVGEVFAEEITEFGYSFSTSASHPTK